MSDIKYDVKNIIKKYWKLFLIIFLITLNSFLWYVVHEETPTKFLKVVFLNIGQGDAIYIESPDHNRILVDGGPEHSLAPELKKVLPFYVRTLDTFINTNPDADHYAGMLDVLPTFHINRFLKPGTISQTPTYAAFEKEIQNKKIPEILARRGMILHLGDGANVNILFPDRDVSNLSSNDGSIIARLTFGSTSVMLTGDAPSATEEYVLMQEGTTTIQSTILKAGHHGSRTSASFPFVLAVDPQVAVISAGLNNQYGHPHKETVDLFNALHIPMLITFNTGDITALSDGKLFHISTEHAE